MNENKQIVQWAIRISEKPSLDRYKIKKPEKLFFTHFGN